MPFMQEPIALQGSCHCGRARIVFSTNQPLAEMSPRACDCSFCQKHGAAYVSDPAGQLRISATDLSNVRSYRQGSEAARFRLCSECGVLVAVTFEQSGRIFGAVNVACLDEHAGFGVPVAASPQSLTSEAKITRWLQVWVPDVELVTSAA